jgi:hypothetical protein
MTNQPRQPKRLDLDEKIAILVAFSVIGTILAWALTRENNVFNTAIFTQQPKTVTSPPVKVEPETTSQVEELKPVPRPESQKKTAIIPPVVTTSRPTPEITITPIPEAIPIPEVTVTPVPEAIPTPEATPTPVPTPTIVIGTIPAEFLDLAQDYWAYPFIMALAERDVFRQFEQSDLKPDQPVTRGEFALWLTESLQLIPKQSEKDFKDVDQESLQKDAIDIAVESKFLTGYPGQVFEPNEPITKMEILLSLVSGLELQPKGDPETILKENYQDWEEIPEYARNAIAAATESGLVVNYSDLKLLKPNQNATRAETAVLIHQALVYRGELPKVRSEYIVNP